jgi:hypothetical protein
MKEISKYENQGIYYKDIDIFNDTGKHNLFSSNKMSNDNLLLLDNNPSIPYELKIDRTSNTINTNLSSGILNYEIILNRNIDNKKDKQIVISKDQLNLEDWNSSYNLSSSIDNNLLTDLFYISDIESIENKEIEISLDIK